MSLFSQVFWGTCILGWCTLLHVAFVSLSIPFMQYVGQHRMLQNRIRLKRAAVLLAVVFALLAGHTLQIWSWALALIWMGSFEGLSESYYFSTVTYTTLGYGDIILAEDDRIFATFASVAGLFTFGISTAFLIGVLARLLPDVFAP